MVTGILTQLLMKVQPKIAGVLDVPPSMVIGSPVQPQVIQAVPQQPSTQRSSYGQGSLWPAAPARVEYQCIGTPNLKDL